MAISEAEAEVIAETDRMVQCFGQENRSIKFDWEETYGAGFDVLNMKVASRAATD